jgi:hypothetical protein
MDTLGSSLLDCDAAGKHDLGRLPLSVFVTQWRFLTGEPPAIMLESRFEMIAILVQSVPVAPLVPVRIDQWVNARHAVPAGPPDEPCPAHRGARRT